MLKSVFRRANIVIFFTVSIISVAAAPAFGATKLFISPGKIEPVKAGESIRIEVRVDDVKDLYGYQCDLVFPPALLKAVKVESLRFLGTGKETFFISGSIDNSKGRINGIAESKRGQTVGSAGGGSLLAVTLEVKKAGSGDLVLEDVKLVKSDVTTIAPLEIIGASLAKSEAPKSETVKSSESGLPDQSAGQNTTAPSTQAQSSGTAVQNNGDSLVRGTQDPGGSAQKPASPGAGSKKIAGESGPLSGSNNRSQSDATGNADALTSGETAGTDQNSKNSTERDRKESKHNGFIGFFAGLWTSLIRWLKNLF